jgi:hypothetical protein
MYSNKQQISNKLLFSTPWTNVYTLKSFDKCNPKNPLTNKYSYLNPRWTRNYSINNQWVDRTQASYSPDQTSRRINAISKILPHDLWSRLFWATAGIRVPQNSFYFSIPNSTISQIVKILYIQTPKVGRFLLANDRVWEQDLALCRSIDS